MFVAFAGCFLALMAVAVLGHLGSRNSLETGLINDFHLENAVMSGTAMGMASLLVGIADPSKGETVFEGELPWDEESTIRVTTGRLGFLHSISVSGKRRGYNLERQCLLAAHPSGPLDAALTVSDAVVIGIGGRVTGPIRSPEMPETERADWLGRWVPMPEGAPEQAAAGTREVFEALEHLLEQPPEDETVLYGAVRIEPNSADSLAQADTVVCFGPVLISSATATGSWSCRLPKLLICLDDLQITGEVLIEDGSVILCSGEARLLDQCRIGHCLVYGAEGCTVADQARATGQVISGQTLQVQGEAMIGPAAIVASLDRILIAGTSWINGSVVSLSGPIHISAEARVDGVVWSGGAVAIDGIVRGSVVAARLESELRGVVSHIITGIAVSPLLVTGFSELSIVHTRPEILEITNNAEFGFL
jgi:hypothetical protein